MPNLTRREFLTLAATMGGAFVLGAIAITRGRRWLRSSEPPPVVVIGSGAAGIATSMALLARDVPVLMLEAGVGGQGVHFAAPYEPAGKPPFEWFQLRGIGGKLLAWLAHIPRFSARDFDEWPLSYDELTPYYTRIERILGLVGAPSDDDQLPDGDFVGPVSDRALERAARQRLLARGFHLAQGRYAAYPNAFARSNWGQNPVRRTNALDRGLETFRPGALYRGALLTHPRFSLIIGAEVRRIDVSERIPVIHYTDLESGEAVDLRTRHVALAAGCLASTQILLQSRSKDFPDGLGNTSGTMGRFFTDHLQTTGVYALGDDVDIRDIDGSGLPRPAHFGAFVTGSSGSVRERAPHLAGAYSVQVHAQAPGNGEPKQLLLNGMSRMEPRPDNGIRLSEDLDGRGLPVPVIRLAPSPADLRLRRRMSQGMSEIARLLGARHLVEHRMSSSSIHYAGTCRMGNSADTSVVDPFGHLHDVAGVSVADSSVFVTNPEKNPTLTAMALAWRGAEEILRRRG